MTFARAAWPAPSATMLLVIAFIVLLASFVDASYGSPAAAVGALRCGGL